ncbi:MAG: carboxylating nicotinate-nucleotide diphosphorylase [Cytophagia bacterium]|nr:MAG: carboxylating nicotinate-nucleotide diphosphorylase [Cytophagia bacterium]TAG39001.1 MAG: carboxylating nicotinate-nucleotide diphosphorylase [Cytophagia bacterium]TAH30491.1 MAG: carboxylating nicotinate-nucleotide diphosphorylase [Cytophagales bacterium]
MAYQYLTDKNLEQFIVSALAEDIGEGDFSTLSSVPKEAISTAKLLIKDNGILAGVDLAQKIFKHLEPDCSFEIFKKDGEKVQKGEEAFRVKAHAQILLQGERLVLNCMQRMSAIATKTNHFTQMIAHTKARLLDTRKTTPNFRMIEKWAVLIGGGTNHRFGLFDMVMLKDNHIDYAGGITKAVQNTQKYLQNINKKLRIEVETRNIDEVKEALSVGGVDVIMLDNMSVATMKEAVKLIGNQAQTEASGGITEDTIIGIAETGVDFISVGALTHAVKSLDLSLKAVV